MVILKQESLDLLGQFNVVLALVADTLPNGLDLVRAEAIEALHFLQELLRDASLEEGVDQLPEVVVILHLPRRDHPVVIRLQDIVILVVK